MSKFDPYEHLQLSLNSDGTLHRYRHLSKSSANPNPTQGQEAATKDVTIDVQKNTWARIYRPLKLPSNDGCVAKLPIHIFFHGGGWIDLSITDSFCDESNCRFASNLPGILISVEYRLAPEHRLPAQYEDAIDAVLWVRKQALDSKGDQWLRDFGDFSRCYMVGRGNGANIAYHASLRALDLDLRPMRISGLILNQPMFSGNHRTKSELKYACDEVIPLPCWDLMWELALPKGADRDHSYCNPMKDIEHRSKIKDLGRCLVIGYGMDPMIDRQQDFVSLLVAYGAKVEAHFDDFGFHGVDIVDKKRCLYNVKLIQEFISN